MRRHSGGNFAGHAPEDGGGALGSAWSVSSADRPDDGQADNPEAEEDRFFRKLPTRTCVRLSRPKSLTAIVDRLSRDLQDLSIHHAGLDGKSVQVVVQSLRGKAHLCKLSLAFNRLGDYGAEALAPLLEKDGCKLMYLNLARNHITPEGCTALAKSLAKNRSLKHLDLAENLCGDEGITAIADVGVSAGWRELVLSKNRMGRAGIAGAARLVRESTSLRSLSLYLNGIDVQGGIMLSDALMMNRSLTHLDVGANPLGSHGVYSLATMLSRNTTLESLDLRGCEITYTIPQRSTGGHSVMTRYGKGTILGFKGKNMMKVKLNYGIGYMHPSNAYWTAEIKETLKKQPNDMGFFKLCEEISKPTCSLRTLLLSFNHLGDAEIQRLCESVIKAGMLKRLGLTNCNISTKGILYITRLLRRSKSLTRLDLGLNTIDKKSARALGQSLRENKTLTSIDLVQCRLSAGINSIINMLPNNQTLRTISLGGNLLVEDHFLLLSTKLRDNYSIEDLGQLMCRCPKCKNRLVSRWLLPEAVTRGGAETKGNEFKDCLAQILGRNKLMNRRGRKIMFLLGLKSERLGSASPLHNILGSSEILERNILRKIFEFWD